MMKQQSGGVSFHVKVHEDQIQCKRLCGTYLGSLFINLTPAVCNREESWERVRSIVDRKNHRVWEFWSDVYIIVTIYMVLTSWNSYSSVDIVFMNCKPFVWNGNVKKEIVLVRRWPVYRDKTPIIKNCYVATLHIIYQYSIPHHHYRIYRLLPPPPWL